MVSKLLFSKIAENLVPENALQPLSNRYKASDGLMRLRNNPYSEVELGKGNIFMLPVPPDNV